MNDINDSENILEDNIEKTIDESAMALQANAAEGTPAPQKTNIPKAYQKAELPSGKEPIKVGSGAIVGVLGTGGMAKVYKIWNEKLEVYRAVKILIPSGGKELTSRFETEAKITAKLDHPNIVKIYNVGDWNDLPYLEMEIIEGVALDNIIDKYGRLHDCVSCSIAIQIAKALTYAHKQEFLLYGKTYKGIIHRDLKPANIMISNRGDLKLMDFGIARPTEVGLHTMEGHIVGTLQYLSPEQLDGVAVDKRSDIYSFGAILYEILTGTKTFPQTTMTNLMKMKATNTYRNFNDFAFEINPALKKICNKCLENDRNNRYENANALLADLRKVLRSCSSDEPIDILQKYMLDPSNYSGTHYKKKIPVKYLTLFGAAAVAAAVLTLSLLPKKDSSEPSQTNTQSIKAAENKIQEKAEPLKPVEVVKPEEQIPPQETRPTAKKRTPRIVRNNKTPKKQEIRIKKSPRKESALQSLKKKYGTSDPVEIGEKACKQGNFSDALKALKSASDDSPKKTILYLWAYVETNNLSKARKYASSFKGKDSFVELLEGRILLKQGKSKNALSQFETAMTKPSIIKKPAAIRRDALFYIALVHDQMYKKSPSPEARLQVLTAWNNLKKVYRTTPSHPRFKLANKKLSTSY